MNENKKFVQLPDARDSLWGKLGLPLLGRAILSKSLYKFSARRCGCDPSLQFGPRQPSPGICSRYGRAIGYGKANGNLFEEDLCQHAGPPRTAAAIAPDPVAGPHLCKRLPNIHRQFWLSLLCSHCSFPLGSDVHRVLFGPSKSLCLPQSCGSSIINLH